MVLIWGALLIFRSRYHVRATSATPATTAQIGTLYVIVFASPSDIATQLALVMFARAVHHFVKELTIKPPITVPNTATTIAQVCPNIIFFMEVAVGDRVVLIAGRLYSLGVSGGRYVAAKITPLSQF